MVWITTKNGTWKRAGGSKLGKWFGSPLELEQGMELWMELGNKLGAPLWSKLELRLETKLCEKTGPGHYVSRSVLHKLNQKSMNYMGFKKSG